METISYNEPPKALIKRLKKHVSEKDYVQLSQVYREALQIYGKLVSETKNGSPGNTWYLLIRDALSFLGGQADRNSFSLKEYDHQKYGPYLGISDEGSAASTIRQAAFVSPKARSLGRHTSPDTLGLAVDAERLGSVGEIPVGPDEYMDIWSECAGRLLMSTNVGSRANIRLYNRALLITIPSSGIETMLKALHAELDKAFKPFVEAKRPLVVFVEFEFGKKIAPAVQQATLRAIVNYVRHSGITNPKIHHIGLNIRVGWGTKGRDSVLRAIELAKSVGIGYVSVDGVVTKDADKLISLPGLLNYFTPELVNSILQSAIKNKIQVDIVNRTDIDSVAREIWSGLNVAKMMGFNLGKYGLFPLSLEECDKAVRQIQHWFSDWTAAPVFYIDQPLMTSKKVFAGEDIAKGCEDWLRTMAKHNVQVVLIDTVDKSRGWKILKTDNDPKGILTLTQIQKLDELGQKMGIRILWAGGITLEQVYHFGTIGVFGIYVTTAVSKAKPVKGTYLEDPGLASEKEPTFAGVVTAKTLLEAGFLLERLKDKSPELHHKIKKAGLDAILLSKVLPEAWRFWWKHKEVKSHSKKRIK